MLYIIFANCQNLAFIVVFIWWTASP